jgi:diaminohydroxyphosphoribosylaminopyrimidine deaminase/5-amino-6-(5-phosphoribosylamino)uracil reductase
VEGKNPTRIVLDPGNKLKTGKIFTQADAPTLVYNRLVQAEKGHVTHVKIEEENFLLAVLNDLYQRKIISVMVEGGAKTTAGFIDAGVWDEARIFECDVLLHKGVPARYITGQQVYHEMIDQDELTIIRHTQ